MHMSTPEHLLNEVLALPDAERAKLVHRLLESLEDLPATDVESAWLDELVKRARDVKDGAVSPIPWESARADIVAELEARRAARRTP